MATCPSTERDDHVELAPEMAKNQRRSLVRIHNGSDRVGRRDSGGLHRLLVVQNPAHSIRAAFAIRGIRDVAGGARPGKPFRERSSAVPRHT